MAVWYQGKRAAVTGQLKFRPLARLWKLQHCLSSSKFVLAYCKPRALVWPFPVRFDFFCMFLIFSINFWQKYKTFRFVFFYKIQNTTHIMCLTTHIHSRRPTRSPLRLNSSVSMENMIHRADTHISARRRRHAHTRNWSLSNKNSNNNNINQNENKWMNKKKAAGGERQCVSLHWLMQWNLQYAFLSIELYVWEPEMINTYWLILRVLSQAFHIFPNIYTNFQYQAHFFRFLSVAKLTGNGKFSTYFSENFWNSKKKNQISSS